MITHGVSTYIRPDGTRWDMPKNEARVKIRCKARVKTILPGGTRIEPGWDDANNCPSKDPPWQDAVIYKSDLATVQALVETELGRIDSAKRDAESKFQHWLHKMGNGQENARFNRNTWGGSVEATFYENNGRGINPLIAVEVLEELAPPKLPEIAGVSSQPEAQSAEMVALKAEMNELKEQLKALLPQKRGPGRPRKHPVEGE